MAKQNIHVVPRGDGWAVQRANGERATSRHDTQTDAIGAGRDIARSEGSELVIHRPDGRIRDHDSYGNDPFPPRDNKH